MISQKHHSFIMLLLTALMTTCIAAVAAQVHPSHHEKIVNGTPAVLGQFPYIVSLRFGDFHLCGGTIISDRWVLTAAHCFKHGVPQAFQAGLIYQPSHGNEYQIEEGVPHPKYDKWFRVNDIALVKSSEPIKVTENVSYALLPKQNLDAGAAVSIAGWGYPSYPLLSIPTRELFYYNASVVDRNECQKALGGGINEGDMCAFSRKHQGTCLGDSGGPLVDGETRSVIHGIVSRGIPCATGVPDIFLNVNAYIDWINSVIH